MLILYYNVCIMKWVLIFSTVWLLQACSSFDLRPSNTQIFDKVPKSWHTTGKLSAAFNGKSQNADFEIDFIRQDYQLILTGSFGFGQIVIKSNSQGLMVDGNRVFLNFKQWMTQQMYWYFPVYDLGKIAFNQPFVNSNWQLQILSRYPNWLPKTIRLIDNTKNIKIKLIFKNITVIEA